MPRNIFLALSVSALALAFLLRQNPSEERQPASVIHAKIGHVHSSKSLGKLRGHGAILSIESQSKTSDGTYSLQGKVKAQNAISSAQVKWAVGKGLEIISGPKQNTINNLNAGETAQFNLVVRGNGQIFFHVMDNTGRLLGETAHANTRSMGNGSFSTLNAAKKKGPPPGLKVFY